MGCKQHGLDYNATDRNHGFCSLCRDLRRLPPDEGTRINDWLAEHQQMLAMRNASIFVLRISDLHVRTEDEDGRPRLWHSEPIKGDVEADFFDHLNGKCGPEPEDGDLRVCIAAINDASVRRAALRFGFPPSLVHRVREDWKAKGIRPATERLLSYARRKLATGNSVAVGAAAEY